MLPAVPLEEQLAVLLLSSSRNEDVAVCNSLARCVNGVAYAQPVLFDE